MTRDGDEVLMVDAASWRTGVAAAHADGWTGFDWLGCVDEIGRADAFTVVLRLLRPDRPADGLRLTTTVPRSEPVLDSIATVFPGAGWHEREGTDLFGVVFRDGDARPLLLDGFGGRPPLRKDAVLGARAATPWPGAKDPSDRGAVPRSARGDTPRPTGADAPAASPSRRRMLPPGVPEPEVWGDRTDPEPADAEEIARSVSGGRVRRRR